MQILAATAERMQGRTDPFAGAIRAGGSRRHGAMRVDGSGRLALSAALPDRYGDGMDGCRRDARGRIA